MIEAENIVNELDNAVKYAERSKEEIRKEISELRRQLEIFETKTKDFTGLLGYIQALDEKVQDLEGKIMAINSKITELETVRIGGIEDKILKLREQLALVVGLIKEIFEKLYEVYKAYKMWYRIKLDSLPPDLREEIEETFRRIDKVIDEWIIKMGLTGSTDNSIDHL